MVLAMVLALALVVGTFLFHYAVFRWLSGGMARIPMADGIRIVVIGLAIFAAHILEVGLYAGVYAAGERVLGLGRLSGSTASGAFDYLYFSIVSYTSLGLGDVVPDTHLRLITGVEAMNGLFLIAWSASFIYIAMGQLWPWEDCARPDCVPGGRQHEGDAE